MDENRNSIDQSVHTYEVFPGIEPVGQEVTVIGKENGKARKLALDLGCKPGDDLQNDVFLIDDFQAYLKDSTAINKLVKNGAKAIFLELPTGTYQLPNGEITVEPTAMGKYYFASPATGHGLVKEFEPFDFRFWYDEKPGYITPLLGSYFRGDGWKPILSSGSVNWEKDMGIVMASGEKKYGKGKFLVCQLILSGRVNENPTAKMFGKKLITKYERSKKNY